jgi:hypothetical protein
VSGHADKSKRLLLVGLSPTIRLSVAIALSLTAVATSACTTSPSTVSESFTGSLETRSFFSRTFIVGKAGTVKLTLTSLAPPSQQIGLGLGTPGVGLSCDLNVTVKATGTAAAQLASQVNPGRYCVEVYDLGTLTDAVSFTLLIEHPR